MASLNPDILPIKTERRYNTDKKLSVSSILKTKQNAMTVNKNPCLILYIQQIPLKSVFAFINISQCANSVLSKIVIEYHCNITVNSGAFNQAAEGSAKARKTMDKTMLIAKFKTNAADCIVGCSSSFD